MAGLVNSADSGRNIEVPLDTENPSTILRYRLSPDLVSPFWCRQGCQGHRRRTHNGVARLDTGRTGSVKSGRFIIVACRALDYDVLEYINIAEW